MMRFKNQTVVITGGSRGIGKAAARHFAAEGADVMIFGRNQEAGERTAAEISSYGTKTRFYQVDVSDLESVRKAGRQIIEEFGRVDVLINNAGITADSSFKKMTEEQFERVISINLKGVFNCTKVFGLHMAEKGKGAVINTSSVVAHYGNFGQTNYVASKTGLIGMTKTWARELGPEGVRVNAVAPGFIKTDMLKTVPEEILEQMRNRVPLKALGEPDQIAKVYLFLASDMASYINGAVLNVDGGLVL